jgi:hypothetical protein
MRRAGKATAGQCDRLDNTDQPPRSESLAAVPIAGVSMAGVSMAGVDGTGNDDYKSVALPAAGQGRFADLGSGL